MTRAENPSTSYKRVRAPKGSRPYGGSKTGQQTRFASPTVTQRTSERHLGCAESRAVEIASCDSPVGNQNAESGHLNPASDIAAMPLFEPLRDMAGAPAKAGIAPQYQRWSPFVFLAGTGAHRLSGPPPRHTSFGGADTNPISRNLAAASSVLL